MLNLKSDLYKTEWLDLVFDNRNKNYGAYELRSHYAATMVKAIALAVVSVVGAALIIGMATKRQAIAVSHIIEDTTQVHLKQLNEIKQVKPKLPATPATHIPHVNTAVIPTRVAPDDAPTIDPPTKAQLAIAAVGTETVKGDPGPVNIPVAATPAAGNSAGVGAAEGSGKDVVDYAEVSPEPFGGMAGWSRFLQRNMRYPNTDVQGRVLLSFIVERDGSLTDVKVIRGIDSQLDAEALRVLKMAPKWKPGLQGGKPVRVQYTIPVNFQLSN